MSIEATWIMLVLTNFFGAVMIFVTLYILRAGRKKRKLTTYSNHHTKEENGPTLELPEGVTLPKSETKA
ncbi:MAG: hypothetical protein CMB80_22920 [Flammeovirgaceae bacterium]|nr:hypothetical protein [Flammeovirgaceae bacterium]MBE61133.1 hypothetical protein [Flammeovirgaceae bacterium]MBR07524.1 hypothetical protein [Rickettsiales bacterium]HCX24296.1 hypothetical protein [Cytophagales bacterium]|tara:strand:+ start:7204 stop:7410 length:207 start_codon:yes stop_codon:yes gene_type:complete